MLINQSLPIMVTVIPLIVQGYLEVIFWRVTNKLFDADFHATWLGIRVTQFMLFGSTALIFSLFALRVILYRHEHSYSAKVSLWKRLAHIVSELSLYTLSLLMIVPDNIKYLASVLMCMYWISNPNVKTDS